MTGSLKPLSSKSADLGVPPNELRIRTPRHPRTIWG
jgi:hypothetical protein